MPISDFSLLSETNALSNKIPLLAMKKKLQELPPYTEMFQSIFKNNKTIVDIKILDLATQTAILQEGFSSFFFRFQTPRHTITGCL